MNQPPPPPGGYQQQGYGQPQQGGYQQQPQQGYQQQQQQQQQYQQQQQPMAAAPAAGGAGMATLGPKGQQLLQEGITMLPGEQVVYSIQADGYFLGTMPLQKLIASFQAFITTITGGHIRIFLVITNQRVLMLQSQQAFCGTTRIRAFSAMALASVLEAGSAKATQGCCFHTRTVYLESKTQKHQLVIKKLGDDGLRDFVANMSAVLVENVKAGTAT